MLPNDPVMDLDIRGLGPKCAFDVYLVDIISMWLCLIDIVYM